MREYGMHNRIELIITEAGSMYEMANLTKTITGIIPVIFCSPKGDARHECRVKVSNVIGKMTAEDTFSIELKDLSVNGYRKLPADQLESVKWWIHQNRFAILDYWKERTDTRDFMNSLKSINLKEEGPR